MPTPSQKKLSPHSFYLFFLLVGKRNKFSTTHIFSPYPYLGSIVKTCRYGKMSPLKSYLSILAATFAFLFCSAEATNDTIHSAAELMQVISRNDANGRTFSIRALRTPERLGNEVDFSYFRMGKERIFTTYGRNTFQPLNLTTLSLRPV